MAKGDSPQRLAQRAAAQRRYVAKRGGTPEAHKEYQRNYYRLKSGAKLETESHPCTGYCDVCGDSIEGKNRQWDHNHKTGKFRGWLCGCCNRAIGQAKESADRLRALAAYVLRHD